MHNITAVGNITLFVCVNKQKRLIRRISLIISNKTGANARASGFITPLQGVDYSLI